MLNKQHFYIFVKYLYDSRHNTFFLRIVNRIVSFDWTKKFTIRHHLCRFPFHLISYRWCHLIFIQFSSENKIFSCMRKYQRSTTATIHFPNGMRQFSILTFHIQLNIVCCFVLFLFGSVLDRNTKGMNENKRHIWTDNCHENSS